MIKWFNNLSPALKILLITGVLVVFLGCCCLSGIGLSYFLAYNQDQAEEEPEESEEAMPTTTSTSIEIKPSDKTEDNKESDGKNTSEPSKDCPQDFPLFPNRIQVNQSKSEIGQVTICATTYRTDADAAAVADFYKKQLPQKGYSISKIDEFEESTIIDFKRGTEIEGKILIQYNPADNMIDVAITMEIK